MAQPERPKTVIKIVESYITPNGVRDRLRARLISFAQAKPSQIKDIIQMLETRFDRLLVEDLLNCSLGGFVEADPQDLPKVFDFFVTQRGRPWLRDQLKVRGSYPFARMRSASIKAYYFKEMQKRGAEQLILNSTQT